MYHRPVKGHTGVFWELSQAQASDAVYLEQHRLVKAGQVVIVPAGKKGTSFGYKKAQARRAHVRNLLLTWATIFAVGPLLLLNASLLLAVAAGNRAFDAWTWLEAKIPRVSGLSCGI